MTPEQSEILNRIIAWLNVVTRGEAIVECLDDSSTELIVKIRLTIPRPHIRDEGKEGKKE